MVSSTRTAPTGETEAARSVSDAGGSSPAPRPVVPLSLAVLLVPAFIGLTRLLLALHRPFASSGDVAILETAVRRVATGTQALGPYSRFGFDHPGPAYFFVQAPFSWLTGQSPSSLFLGALVINFGAAVAAVAVVRRFSGEAAARWAAVVVAAYLLAVTPALLTDPWNPYVLAMPLLLSILLAAAGAAGSAPAWAGAAVAASYVVQTHVGTAPTVSAVFAVAIAVGIAGRHRRSERVCPAPAPAGRRRLWLGAAGIVLALLWAPPLVEQATHSPGNLTKMVRFFGDSHPEHDAGVDHSLGTASTKVAAELVTVPFGRSTGHRAARDVAAAAAALAAAGLGVAGWRRRNLFVATLGATSLGAAAAAVVSTTRIVGEVLPYLLVWGGVLLLPAWIGFGPLLQPAAPTRRRAKWAVTAGAGVLGVALAWSMLRAPLPPVPADDNVLAATRLARSWLDGGEARHVRVRIAEPSRWPLAAGVITGLERHDFHVTVDRNWASLFGDQFSPTDRERAQLWITVPAGSPPVGDLHRLGEVGGASLWAGRLEPAGRP